jgi:hypothetical protein
MVIYLHQNPYVLAAIMTASALLIAMLARGFISVLFLRALHRETPEFWRSRFGGTSIALARFSYLTPSTLRQLARDPNVVEICDRFAPAWRNLSVASAVLFAVTAALLIGSGLRGQ